MKKLYVLLSDNSHDLTDNGVQHTPEDKFFSVYLYLAVKQGEKSEVEQNLVDNRDIKA